MKHAHRLPELAIALLVTLLAAALASIEPSTPALPAFLEGRTGPWFDVRRWKMLRAAMAKGP